MSTELAVRRQLTPDVWQMITAVAPVMKDSRLFGVASDSQAAAVMAKGYELGLSITTAFEYVTVIDGKPSLTPRGALALILASPLCAGVEIKDMPDGCQVTMKRKGGFQYTATWTLDDAKRAGLVKGGSGWEKYPANMCRWRAVGYAADVVFPDVLGGLKRADEFGADLTVSGDVIETSWTPAAPASDGPQTTAAPLAASMTLAEAVQAFGADAIINANGGRIPATQDELQAVLTALGGAE